MRAGDVRGQARRTRQPGGAGPIGYLLPPMSESYDAETLSKKTVAELREIAKQHEHDALSGYQKMKKAELVEALGSALGSEPAGAPEGAEEAPGEAQASPPAAAPAAPVKAPPPGERTGKQRLKEQIKQLKVQRDAAVAAHETEQLRLVRRKIHRLKRRIRREVVA